GAITMFIIAVFFKPPQRKKVDKLSTRQKLKQFDFLGTIFLLPSIICLLLALLWGGTEYEWSNGRIIALFIVAGVLAIILTIIQFKGGENATLPIRLVTQRTIAGRSLLALCMGAAFFILVFDIPIWFQYVKG